MPASQTLEITYLLEAVDKATKVIEGVTKTNAALTKSFEEADKATKEAEKAQKSFGKTAQETSSKFEEFANKVGAGEAFDRLKSALKTAVGAAAGLGASLAILSARTSVVLALTNAVTNLNEPLARAIIGFTRISEGFPLIARSGGRAIAAASKGMFRFLQSIQITNIGLTSFFGSLINTGKGAGEVARAFGRALTHTEFFEKGIFALTTKLSTLGAGFGALGFALLRTDSVMLKLAGGTLVAFAAAMGGVAFVIQRSLAFLGEFITAAGTGLVNALQKTIDTSIEAESKTQAFEFVLINLERATKGAIGTFEEWNQVVEEVRDNTGTARGEIQNSISELLRFGDSIGLTRDEMMTLVPIISDVAAANHKDLFTSTLAVVEALAGQTVMLQNMGINLTQAAIKEAGLTDEIGKNISQLTEHEKVQLRFNLLLKKANVLQGISQSALQTTAGALKRQEALWKDLSAAIGEGAAIVETRVINSFSILISIFGEFSENALQAVGVIGAISGRLLQIIGLTTQWAFSIVLVSSSIKALNVLLASRVIQNFLISMSKAAFLTQTLASKNAFLAETLSVTLARLGTAGLSITSLGTLIRVTIVQIAKTVAVVVAPFVVLAAKVLAVAAVFGTLFLAFKKIEEVTGVFSRTYERLVSVFDSSTSGPIARLKQAFSDIGLFIQQTFIRAVFELSKGIVTLYGFFLDLYIGVIDVWAALKNLLQPVITKVKEILEDAGKAFDLVKEKLTAFADDARERLASFADKAKEKFQAARDAVAGFVDRGKEKIADLAAGAKKELDKLPDGLKSGINTVINNTVGIANAAANGMERFGEATKILQGETKSLTEEQKRAREAVSSQQAAIADVIAALEMKKQAEIDGLTLAEEASEKAMERHHAELEAIDLTIEALQQLQVTNRELAAINAASSGIKAGYEAAKEEVAKIVEEVRKAQEEGKEVGQALSDSLDAAIEKARIFRQAAAVSGAVNIALSVTQGSAAILKTAITTGLTAALGPFGKILGDAISPLIDVLGQTPEKFRQQIVEAIAGLPELIANIIVNILSIDLIIAEALEKFADNLPMMVERIARAFTRVLFASATPIVVRFVAAFIRNIPEIVQGFIDGIRDGIQDAINPLRDLRDFWKDSGKEFVDELLQGAGKFIDKLVDEVKGAFKGIIGSSSGGGILGTVGSAVSAVADVFGFQDGGMIARVNGGGISDSVPAVLAPGEVVIDRSLTRDLRGFLDEQGTGNNATNAILLQILSALNSGKRVETSVEFNEETLANIILNMNRDNLRLEA